MDRETEREVWRRVNRPGGLPAEQALLPDRLERMILEQRMNAIQLRDLAGRLPAQERRIFFRMSSENDNRARELTTLHYLITGRSLRLKLPSQPAVGDLTEALREAFFRQKQSAAGFEALAQEFSGYADQFSRLADQAQRHSNRIRQALQAHLERPPHGPTRPGGRQNQRNP